MHAQVLSGEVAPDVLVVLPPEELASDAKKVGAAGAMVVGLAWVSTCCPAGAGCPAVLLAPPHPRRAPAPRMAVHVGAADLARFGPPQEENQRIREKKLFDSAPSAAKQARFFCMPRLLHAVHCWERRCRRRRPRALAVSRQPSRCAQPELFATAVPSPAPCPTAALAPQATTDQFQCGKCRQRKTTYYQMQTRSADEPVRPLGTLRCGGVATFEAVAAVWRC